MTLWTPDGERPIGKPDTAQNTETTEPVDVAQSASNGPDSQADLSPEHQQQAREMAQGLTEAREQLLEANVADVVANHAFGLYELAAIHLTAEAPDMVAARLSIDALGALVDGLSGRLGEAEATLTEALQQLRMMFVQRTTQLKKSAEEDSS